MAKNLAKLSGDELADVYRGWRWCVIKTRSSSGKAPAGSWKEFQQRLPTDEEHAQLLRHVERGGGMFLVCGSVSGVVVLDLDDEQAQEWWRERLGEDWERIPKAKTPRGLHLYFAGEGVQSQGGEGWDLKGEGGGVVLPSGNGKRAWLTPPHAQLPDFSLIASHLDGAPRTTRDTTRDDAIPEGERDTALTSLAGSMRRAGASEKAILAALIAENERATPPLSREQVEKIARSVARYATGFDAEVAKEVEHLRVREAARDRLRAERGPVADLSLRGLADASAAASEELDWVIPGLLVAGEKLVVAGPPKSLKTWFVLHLARAIAVGERVLDRDEWHVAAPQPVLFVQEEGAHQRWGQRLVTTFKGNEDAPLAYMHRAALSLLNPHHVEALIERATDIGARAIFLDPLQRITPGVNENDAAETGPAWDAIHRLAGETGAAVGVLHHARKGEREPSMDAIRGSSRVAGEVDLMFVLRKAEEGVLECFIDGRELPNAHGDGGTLEVKYDPDAPHRMRLGGPRIRVKGAVNSTRPAVAEVLQQADEPLTTAEVQARVEQALGRERNRSSISRELNALAEAGDVKKIGPLKGKVNAWERADG